MLSPSASGQDWRTCLAEGDIVVFLWPVAGPIAAARALARRRCSALLERLPGHHASRSSTAGLAAVALSRSARVGVDVERIDSALQLDDDLLSIALDPAERATIGARGGADFLRLWTRKESALKAAGVGLALQAATVHVGWHTGDWTSVDFGARASPASVRTLASAPSGFAAAIATLGRPREVRIVTQSTNR